MPQQQQKGLNKWAGDSQNYVTSIHVYVDNYCQPL